MMTLGNSFTNEFLLFIHVAKKIFSILNVFKYYQPPFTDLQGVHSWKSETHSTCPTPTKDHVNGGKC